MVVNIKKKKKKYDIVYVECVMLCFRDGVERRAPQPVAAQVFRSRRERERRSVDSRRGGVLQEEAAEVLSGRGCRESARAYAPRAPRVRAPAGPPTHTPPNYCQTGEDHRHCPSTTRWSNPSCEIGSSRRCRKKFHHRGPEGALNAPSQSGRFCLQTDPAFHTRT